MWRGIKACQKRLLYKSYYVISIGSRWGELRSFGLTSKGSVSWANILSHFHRASLTLAALCRHTWQWQMRQCVEEWGGGGGRGEGGGGGSPRKGWLPPPEETLTHWPRLVASQRWPPLAQGQLLWVHIFTPGQIARQARKSSPPIPTSLPAHLLLFRHPRTLYLGHHQLPSDLQSFFSSFLISLYVTSPVLRWLCTYIPCAWHWSLKTLFAILWIYVIEHYILGSLFTTLCMYG